MSDTLTISTLIKEDCAILADSFQQIGWDKPLSLFEDYLAEQTAGIRQTFVAKYSGKVVGYITILWSSDHIYFRQNNIPEIKDLNIFPAFQRRGFGKSLLSFAENQIILRAKISGIGVGLTQDYGVAQRLYVKNGYIPTAEGVSHHNKILKYGDQITIDDETILWFTKNL